MLNNSVYQQKTISLCSNRQQDMYANLVEQKPIENLFPSYK